MRPAVERRGRAAAPGIAAGPVVRLDRGRRSRREPTGDPARERARPRGGDRRGHRRDRRRLPRRLDGEAADILEFQVAMLEDDALSQPAFAAIADGRRRRRRPGGRRSPPRSPTTRRPTTTISAPAPPTSTISATGCCAHLAGEGDADDAAGRRARRRGPDAEPLPVRRLDAGRRHRARSPAARPAMSPCWRARAACRWWSASAPLDLDGDDDRDRRRRRRAGSCSTRPPTTGPPSTRPRADGAARAAREAAMLRAAGRDRATASPVAVMINVAEPEELDAHRSGDLRRHRPGAHRVPVPRPGGPARRGDPVPRLSADRRMGRRPAGDPPHPRRRRRQAGRRA